MSASLIRLRSYLWTYSSTKERHYAKVRTVSLGHFGREVSDMVGDRVEISVGAGRRGLACINSSAEKARRPDAKTGDFDAHLTEQRPRSGHQ
jgi:hypothetical protein